MLKWMEPLDYVCAIPLSSDQGDVSVSFLRFFKIRFRHFEKNSYKDLMG